MRAVLLYGQRGVRVESVPDPTLQGPTDVIVRITTSAICGSDLHPFHGRILPDALFSIGHEFVVVEEETGEEVRAVKRGDRVVAPFTVSYGFCTGPDSVSLRACAFWQDAEKPVFRQAAQKGPVARRRTMRGLPTEGGSEAYLVRTSQRRPSAPGTPPEDGCRRWAFLAACWGGDDRGSR
jgi:Zn-dependent alcohol dehydrogenase